MNVPQFKQLPIMGILRGVTDNMIQPLVEAIVSSGLRTVEITMNTEDAPTLISQMVNLSRHCLTIGAGTVLTLEELNAALGAGATFIVMPTLVRDVVASCAEKSIPVFPGALTPQEIFDAWNAGATMVKIFPAKCFGPSYFKEVKGPFQDIELLACGGVTEDNMCSYFENGASATSFGGSIFKKEWLETGAFDKIEKRLSDIIQAFNKSAMESFRG